MGNAGSDLVDTPAKKTEKSNSSTKSTAESQKRPKPSPEADEVETSSKKKARTGNKTKSQKDRRKENTNLMKWLESGNHIKLYDINKDEEHYTIEVSHTFYHVILTPFCSEK